MSSSPDNLSPVGLSSAYELEILENIYSYGTTFHPETHEFKPWGFKDWKLSPENVGTGEPTLVGELRDDLTFSDGKAVTAEDIKFTLEYATEQGVTGMVAASHFDAVEEVTVDSPNGTTVSYFFSEKDSGWFSNVLGSIILPKHIWKNVSDYSTYTPRKTKEGVVGSGPMTVKDFNWENWIELETRPTEEIPLPSADYVDWIHEDGPFIDGLRFELFGSSSAMQQSVLNGDVTVTRGSFQVDRAVEATKKDFLDVKESPSDGWYHHSYNTRRVPLDDPAFRQLLVLLNDKKWIIEKLHKGIGAVKGSYATLPVYDEWRPPEPEEIEEYEGIPVADLSFPGNRGSFELAEAGIQKAREFLQTHPRAKHDYSFGKAVSDHSNAPDGKELYVNGKPLTEAHTDNDGKQSQGPIGMNHDSPDKDPNEAQIAQRWLGALQRVGVPAKPNVGGEYGLFKEDFDVSAFGWTRTTPNNDHFRQRFGRWGADVESETETIMFNLMGYTGADSLIEKQSTMFEADARKEVVKKVLAQIWADAPCDIVSHAQVLQPVNSEFTGWINTLGGVSNPHSWMNVRKTNK